MTFTEWLKIQAQQDREVDTFLRTAVEDNAWPETSNNLKSFVTHLKTKGATVDICGNLLKFWAKYLKVVSSVRPINADEIREIREVLVNMLKWIRCNNNSLSNFEEKALTEAENQVACLEEKEIELRYISIRLRDKS